MFRHSNRKRAIRMALRVQVFESYRRENLAYDIRSPETINRRLVGDIKRIEVTNNTDVPIQIYATNVGPFGSLSSGFYNTFDEPLYAKRANVGRYRRMGYVDPRSYCVIISNMPTKEVIIQSMNMR